MTKPPRQIRLNLNLQTAGRHDAAWKTLPDAAGLVTDVDYYVRVARLAEKGKLDGIFFADSLGSLSENSVRRPWRGLDPTVLLSAIAQHTSAIGLVSTVPAIHGSPFVTARQIASLDHVSKGRAAWNIITSQNPPTLDALGKTEALDSETRYRKAGEFVEIVTGLWDSLPQEAIVNDPTRDLYIDESQTRPVEYEGEFYSTNAVLPLTGGHRGRPVLFQAGASARSREFGATWADALFTGQRTKQLAQRFSADVKGLAAQHGRDPEKLLVLPGLWVIVGDTEQAAHARKAELDAQLDADYLLEQLAERLGIAASRLVLDEELPYDELSAPLEDTLVARHREQIIAEARGRLTVRQLLYNNLTGGHRVLIGTPEQIADDIADWVDDGASDGFNINIDRQPDGLESFIDGPVAVLQNRGRFRADYEFETLRENLGVA
ncbi:NtaA/DmoA family FMN-dependent monooxygenase [Microbacterium allomyrinae]|jgi:FMN-dependent oxidoreductase (nitrilotriacetate monooxygenase family)|uniref:NtaA/DmoA family FMN-dependent monooxygenase n=1 Tax=Microbacterium allomyrinae TaxID=2830666 RepID=A0A9X1S4Q6_9MICO|nr:NtaA/DmoA family FMN-dependent monooxygenase [Microbacterium allomyrinae]MCC2033717.1 NtaA/DmoA family FMN-dependent monooxygenase [Microbacterium allomyrinae]